MLSSNYAVCGQINSTFTKNKELHNCDENKTNKIINRFLLTGDKFMLELHLKKPGFTLLYVEHMLNIVKEFKNLEKQVI